MKSLHWFAVSVVKPSLVQRRGCFLSFVVKAFVGVRNHAISVVVVKPVLVFFGPKLWLDLAVGCMHIGTVNLNARREFLQVAKGGPAWTLQERIRLRIVRHLGFLEVLVGVEMRARCTSCVLARQAALWWVVDLSTWQRSLPRCWVNLAIFLHSRDS